jgi:hypothetical protein
VYYYISISLYLSLSLSLSLSAIEAAASRTLERLRARAHAMVQRLEACLPTGTVGGWGKHSDAVHAIISHLRNCKYIFLKVKLISIFGFGEADTKCNPFSSNKNASMVPPALNHLIFFHAYFACV